MIGFVKHKSTWYTQPKKLYQHLPTFLPCPNVCWGLRQFAVLVLFVCKSHLHLVAIARLYKNRDVGDGWAGWSISHPDFCKSDNLISTIEGSAPNSNYVYLPTQLSVASFVTEEHIAWFSIKVTTLNSNFLMVYSSENISFLYLHFT